VVHLRAHPGGVRERCGASPVAVFLTAEVDNHRVFGGVRQWFDPEKTETVGESPDYRFSLANERTFLAWIRTGLALIAGAIRRRSWSPDRGASAERTRLAWRRTGLSATAVALLVARPAFAPRAGVAIVLVAAAAMAGWAALIALAYRRARGLDAHPPRSGRRTITAYALMTIGFALIGGLVVTL